MKKIHTVPFMVAAALIVSAPLFAAGRGEEAAEKTVMLSAVPKPAVDAARQALGTQPTEAKIISGTSPQQYELEARNTAGQQVAVHVRGDGTIVKHENESGEHHER